MSLDHLVDRVWSGEVPPGGADRTVRTYVSRLRAVLEMASHDAGGLLQTISGGYALGQDRIAKDEDSWEVAGRPNAV